MRHAMSGRKFGRTSSHRKAMLTNLAKSLVQYEQITTTLPKAKDLRSIVDRLITEGKKNTLAARRRLIAKVGCRDLAEKVMTILAERYNARAGGYTRVLKAGFRHGDHAPMAVIELVDRDPSAKPKKQPEIIEDDAETAPEAVSA